MIYWRYWMIAAGAFLLFLLYNEWTRRNRQHLWGRLLASLLSVTGLAGMAYPYLPGQSGPGKIVVLTDGFSADRLDQLLQGNTSMPVFATPGLQQPDGMHRSFTSVINWSAFAKTHLSDTMYVLGNGFDRETLEQLQPHAIVWQGGAVPPAITHIYWKQLLQAGEPLILQGHYENSSAATVKIVLQAFGATKDSVAITAGSSRDFSLQTLPLHQGQAVYSLVVLSGKDTMQTEPVPVAVELQPPLQVLILASSPDFENTFLKNNLSRQGYQFSVASTVSKNKINRQFLNSRVQQGPLTPAWLARFDVLMADGTALQQINAAERAAVQWAIKEKGIGLIMKLDTLKQPPVFYNSFFPVQTLAPGKSAYRILRGGITDNGRLSIKITDPVGIVYRAGTQVLLQDEQSAVYAAAAVYGNGKIIASTLQNTYSTALAGNLAAYRQLWWLLLNKAAKRVYPEETRQAALFLPVKEEPVQWLVEKDEDSMHAFATPTRMHLKQDARLPFQWQGMYWPELNGWQVQPGGRSLWYVYQPGDWQQIKMHESAVATKAYASRYGVPAAVAVEPVFFHINWPLLLLLVFVSSCIFLWVEQKAG